MRIFHAAHPADLEGIAARLLKEAADYRLFAFYGEMGVGKTTMILALIKHLGVVDKGSSPTYSIVNEYRTNDGAPVYHFDFYRITDVEEVYDIGYEDYFYGGAYCFVEWPERIGELLPEDAVKVVMRDLGDRRKIEIILPH